MTSLPISEAGVYDIPAEDYHADPVVGGSLSSSGARRLLATCPAKFRYERDHPRAPTKAMELGSAAHREVLGVGPDIVEVKAPDWRTDAAKAARDDTRQAGDVPLLTRDYERVKAMAAKLREHDLAAALLTGRGRVEQTLVWRDGPTRVWRRALLDHLPEPEPSGHVYVADYKTADSAAEEAISKAMAAYGYNAQGAWYTDAVLALGLAATASWHLVVQEKEPPYLVSVVQVDQVAMDAGRHHNRKALDLYAECVKTDTWPAYVDGMALVGLPGWAENRFLKEVTS